MQENNVVTLPITKEGILSETSTFGDWVNVAAPSESIKLPSIYGVDEYGDFSGTSCATPFVTSVKPCDCKVTMDDGAEKLLNVERGLLSVTSESVTLMSGSARSL